MKGLASIRRAFSIVAVVVCLSGCASPARSVAPVNSTSARVPGKLGGYDPARDASADLNAAMDAGYKDGHKVLVVFGASDNADCQALALLSGDPAVAPLVADYHVVMVDVGDPGPHLEANRRIPLRMFLDLRTAGMPAVIVTKMTTANRAENLYDSNDGSFTGARSMTASQLAAFLAKWR